MFTSPSSSLKEPSVRSRPAQSTDSTVKPLTVRGIARPEVFDTVEQDVHRRVQEIGNGDRDVGREQAAVLEPFKQIDADRNTVPGAAAGIIRIATACIAERITEYGYLSGVFGVPVKSRLDAEEVVLKPAAVSEDLGCFTFADERNLSTYPARLGKRNAP